MLRHVNLVVISGLCFFFAAKRCNPKIANFGVRSEENRGKEGSPPPS
jgi:hypothetical protein